jgi:hypothetical protein
MSDIDPDATPCTATKANSKAKCGKPAVPLTDPPRCPLHIEREFVTNRSTNRRPRIEDQPRTTD